MRGLLPTCEGAGSCSSILSAMKHWSMQLKASMNRSRMFLACTTISGNFSSERPHRSSCVLWTTTSMRRTRSPAAVQLEDRQIIRRFLDRYFPCGGLLLPLAIFRPAFVVQNRSDGFPVQQLAAAVNQRLKDLIHVPTDLENQVTAVLHLIIRILVMKPALLLLHQVEREARPELPRRGHFFAAQSAKKRRLLSSPVSPVYPLWTTCKSRL